MLYLHIGTNRAGRPPSRGSSPPMLPRPVGCASVRTAWRTERPKPCRGFAHPSRLRLSSSAARRMNRGRIRGRCRPRLWRDIADEIAKATRCRLRHFQRNSHLRLLPPRRSRDDRASRPVDRPVRRAAHPVLLPGINSTTLRSSYAQGIKGNLHRTVALRGVSPEEAKRREMDWDYRYGTLSGLGTAPSAATAPAHPGSCIPTI